MTVVPAQLDQSVPESAEEFVERSWFPWQAEIQLFPYLARTSRGLYPPMSKRAEILRHELDGSVRPGPNLFWRRIEQVSWRQIFRVVNHVSNRRLAPAL